MVVMNRIRVNKRVEKKLAKGLVLLEASDLADVHLKDQEVEVHSQDGNFLGTAYLSQQNKGLGWFVSTDKVTSIKLSLKCCLDKLKKREEPTIKMI